MLAKDIKVGGHYLASVNGRVVTVRVDRIWKQDGSRRNGMSFNSVTSYDVTNLATGRRTTFRSAQKFRREVRPTIVGQSHKDAQTDGAEIMTAEWQAEQGTRSRKSKGKPPTEVLAGDDARNRTPDAEMDASEREDPPEEVARNRGMDGLGDSGLPRDVPETEPTDNQEIERLEAEVRQGGEQGPDPTPGTSATTGGSRRSTATPSDSGGSAASAGPASKPAKPGSPAATARPPAADTSSNGSEDENRPDPSSAHGATRTSTSATATRPSSADPRSAPATNGRVSEPEAAGLKGDQLGAFEEVTARLDAKQTVTKLVGYAGSGKTFLLARIAKWAVRKGFEVTVAAPTHKAAGVIKDKLGDSRIQVRTIHSLLGLRLEPDWESDSGGRILQAQDSKSKVKRGLVICDEASMVGETLKEHIDRTAGVSWLFVGDLAQLPPVGESISKMLADPDATLEQVLRQAQGSEILNLATRIRRGDQSMEFEEGKDVHRVSNAEDLFQAALRRFDSDDYRRDASHARMLVFKNRRREALNRRMRSLLVNAGPDEPYTAGEWLVMYAQFSPEKSRLNLLAEKAKQYKKGDYGYGRSWKEFFNYRDTVGQAVTQLHVSEEVLVGAVGKGRVEVGQWGFNVWKLQVTTKGGGSYELPVLMDDCKDLYMEVLKEQVEEAQNCRQARDQYGKGSAEWLRFDESRKKAWGVYFTLEEMFAQVDYAYAMTVHKSQGSTFDHVFVDVPDLLTAGGMIQKILYTAVTRPAKSLTFYV